ncbi:S9 family peptidase [Paenibacillus barcinonensis]|uniref:Dipeptidyl aminopeptidase/acylaminoacyl peptidase n=1 Tax=Paenibacillus barcinonensis TaxID=198119 RepID=A0A2V4VLS1_PAEBA|nr:S9 family peptidase [Paenibacillus barcinonensis]PYE50335.1 dipeptidyl aminopeptidase/acylaminoacyl peptidase [Paenibacillus barcinonensis]QKS55011.1 S9 family peptidase [Paenibacillus barcinonensis]
MNKGQIMPEDLYHYRWISQPVISSNGQVAYVEQTIDQMKNEYHTQIRGISLDGTEDVELTGGTKDSFPAWSPDGSSLTFLRSAEAGKGLWALQTGEPEAVMLISPERKIMSYVWSPDGKYIAFTSKIQSSKAQHRDGCVDDESLNKSNAVLAVEPASVLRGKVYERTTPKAEGAGWWDGQYTHLFVYEIDSGQITQMTSGYWSVNMPVWSPDSLKLAFMSKQTKEEHLDPDLLYHTDVYIISIDDAKQAKPYQVTDSSLQISQYSFTPDGKQLILIASDRQYGSGSHNQLFTISLERGIPRLMAPELDMHIGNAALSDMKSVSASPSPVISQSFPQQGVYVLGTHDGNVDVYRVHADGSSEVVTPAGEKDVYQYTIAADEKTLVVAALTDSHPGELYIVEVETGQMKQLTRRNDEFMAGQLVNVPQRIEFTSSDGWLIQGWLAIPDVRSEGKIPLILQIHGGPHAMYAGTFSHEMQTLLADGYAVLWINPRGSIGYGQNFARACRGDFAGGDYRDLMEAVDYALATNDKLDELRMGVAGGSYGGVMTNWIIAHSSRFKAAVTQRCISNWLSMYGTSDIGISYVEGVIGGNPAEHAAYLWSRSPLAHAHQIETPLLIMHGEQDYRTPIAQAEELYTTLKRYGKTTKLIRYPGSNHSLLKSGKPSLRVDSFEQVKAWFKQYL